MRENTNFFLITCVIVSTLLISNITVGSIKQTRENNDDIIITKLNLEEKTLSYNRKPITIPKKNDLKPLSSPIHDYDGDQSHPALAKSEYMGYISAFKDENSGTIAWSSRKGNTSVFEVDGGDYPTLKLWDETTFYGTFVPDENDSHGGIVYLFSTNFPENPSTYQLTGWDWSSLPDYPDQILWHNIRDTEISCNPSKENWEWGMISFVGSTNYDQELNDAPFLTYQTSADGFATISWHQVEGCEHVDNVIDTVSLKAFSVFDMYNPENQVWGLFIRQDFYDDWEQESVAYEYNDEDANYKYPAVSAHDDKLVIIAETDENENKDLICLYGKNLENLNSQVIFETEEDERFPQIRHFEGETFIATYVKNGNLYGIQTDDAGHTWSSPWKINEHEGLVFEEYAASDLCERGILTIWEKQGDDVDLWIDAGINNELPSVPTIETPEKGKPDEEIEITLTSMDPDGDDVYYYVDYGDGVLSGWLGPYESGKPLIVTHTWSEENLFNIRAKAKDENGLETEWSKTEISVPKKYEISSDSVHLDVSIFGASLLTGIRKVGFSVHNSGGNPHDKTIEDITVRFTVKSVIDESIDFSYSKEIDSMAYNEGNQFLTNAISGYGPIELSLTASSSNAKEVSKTMRGYQIGSVTFSQIFLLSELIQ